MTTLADKIEALAKDATPGPWKKGSRRNCDIDIIGKPTWACNRYGKKGEWGVAVVTELESVKEQRANAGLIVELVNNLPTIIRALRERDQAVEALTKATADIAAALIMAGKEGKIAKWTAPYVETINRIDASIEGTGHE